MKHVYPALLGIVVLTLTFASGCDLLSILPTEDVPAVEVPEPDTVAFDAAPADAAEIYYLVRSGENADRLRTGPEPILTMLLRHRIDLVEAWYPNEPVPCMALNAVEALVVQLDEPDNRIHQLDFIDAPGHWNINCGVDTLLHYDFDS